MVFKLFKNGDELYDEGNELIKQGEFAEARDVLQKSIDKDGGTDDVAAAMVALIDLGRNLSNVNAYRKLLQALKAMNASEFEFGLTHVLRDDLITECELTIRKMELLSSGTGSATTDDSNPLIKLAQEFQARIGDRHLIVVEIFKNNTTVTGMSEFFNIMAIAYERAADAVVWDNPTQAAEYQQIAMGYRQQNGQSGEENMAKIRSYSMTGKCWLCGRIATGEGIHFFSAPAEITSALDKGDGGPAKSSLGDGKHIFICRACYSAVSNRSDEISRQYYDDAMRELRSAEARLQAQIAALQTQIAMVRMSR